MAEAAILNLSIRQNKLSRHQNMVGREANKVGFEENRVTVDQNKVRGDQNMVAAKLLKVEFGANCSGLHLFCLGNGANMVGGGVKRLESEEKKMAVELLKVEFGAKSLGREVFCLGSEICIFEYYHLLLMSKLFRKNDDLPPVSEKDREWLEYHFQWLLNSFGKENVRKRKVLTPHYNHFPINYNGERQPIIDTLKIVAEQMEINPDDIIIEIYKEGQQEISSGSPFGNSLFMQNVEGQKYSGGLYFGKHEEGKYFIGLEEKNIRDPLAVVALLAHEFSHIKLMGEERIKGNSEPMTDLTTIIFGLGIFNANIAFRTWSGFNSWGWSKMGYLTQMQWGYALALFSHFREEQQPDWIEFLSKNVKADFKKSMNFILCNPDTLYRQPTKKENYEPINNTADKIREARKNNDFDALITLNIEKLKANPNNKVICNNIGYYLLQKKKYQEAIDYFNRSISIEPRYDFAYNNRGYCKLQLNDMKGAFNDISKACELNPFNSFSWRNLGAYYLKTKQYEKALENFEEAKRLDDKTSLINFYFGKVYEKLRDQEKAKQYFDKSAELNEHIDCIEE